MSWNNKNLMDFLADAAREEVKLVAGIKDIFIASIDEGSFAIKLKQGNKDQIFVVSVKEASATEANEIEFLGEEQDWRLGLHNGDEVTIDIHAQGDRSDLIPIVIRTIQWNGNNAIIVDSKGVTFECHLNDIS